MIWIARVALWSDSRRRGLRCLLALSCRICDPAGAEFLVHLPMQASLAEVLDTHFTATTHIFPFAVVHGTSIALEPKCS